MGLQHERRLVYPVQLQAPIPVQSRSVFVTEANLLRFAGAVSATISTAYTIGMGNGGNYESIQEEDSCRDHK